MDKSWQEGEGRGGGGIKCTQVVSVSSFWPKTWPIKLDGASQEKNRGAVWAGQQLSDSIRFTYKSCAPSPSLSLTLRFLEALLVEVGLVYA